MLTYSQAACLVLDKIPTHINRQQAKAFFVDSPLDVVYLTEGNPLEPLIVAKSIVIKNPYRYKNYPTVLPETPISSSILPANTCQNNKAVQQGSTSSIRKPSAPTKKLHTKTTSTAVTPTSNRSTAINTITVNTKSTKLEKNDILNYLKTTYQATKPNNSDDYEALFLTNIDLYQGLKARYPHIENDHSLQRICLWLHGEIGTFGPLKARRVGNLVKKGRMLWKPKPKQTTS